VLGNPDVKVDSAGESIVLKGSVANALASEQAVTVARGFFPEKSEKVINLLEVGGDQQVMLEVVVAEMARSLRREMGTNFQVLHVGDNHTAQVFNFLNNLTSVSVDPTTGATTTLLSDAINLAGRFTVGSDVYDIFFDVLHEKGLGKILAEPTLVARSGETASFLAGGEIPIPIAQGGAFGSITIEFKEFGVGVAFTPTVLSADRIHLKVAPEVSAPDFTNAVTFGGSVVPSFNTRRASTAVELADGQSFAIAGLLRDDVLELVSQYPVLGEIPVLGILFRSSQFQKNETELVMIVTPHLVKPLPPGDPHLPTDHFVEPNAFEFYLLGALEGRSWGSHHDDESAQTGGLIGDVGHTVAAAPEGEAR
jgi:pilus assembly protein CpaC